MNTMVIITFILLQCFSTNVLNSDKQSTKSSLLQIETSESFDRNYLKDFWIGQGYGCGGRSNIPEDISVEYVGDEFVATKVNGDPCVPSGKVTFRGKIPENWKIGKQYPCTITLGSPARPASSKGACKVVPVDQNKFRVVNWNLTFIRGRLPVKEEPKIQKPNKVQPKKQKRNKVQPKKLKLCKKYPSGKDNEDAYKLQVNIDERFRRAKYPYKRLLKKLLKRKGKTNGLLRMNKKLLKKLLKKLKAKKKRAAQRRNRRRERRNRLNRKARRSRKDRDNSVPRRSRRSRGRRYPSRGPRFYC